MSTATTSWSWPSASELQGRTRESIIGSLSKPGRRRQREDPGKDCFRISDAFATVHILILAHISSVSAKVFIASSSPTTEERLW